MQRGLFSVRFAGRMALIIALATISTVVYAQQRRFVPVWSGNGFMHMNIYVSSASIDGNDLSEGDEIGVFDRGYCVGSIVLQRTIDPFVSIPVSMNDPGTNEIDGYTSGNAIIFKIWDNRNRIEHYQPYLNVTYTHGRDIFIPGSTSVVFLRMEVKAPQNVNVRAINNQIIISWDAVNDALGYRVYSAPKPDIDSFTPDNTGAFEGTIWRAPLPPHKARFYFVKALFE